MVVRLQRVVRTPRYLLSLPDDVITDLCPCEVPSSSSVGGAWTRAGRTFLCHCRGRISVVHFLCVCQYCPPCGEKVTMLPVRGGPLLRSTAALCRITGNSGLRSSDHGFRIEDRRSYKSQPTHGIGRYRFLLPPEVDQKKKGKLLKKEIKQGTEYEYGVVNFQVSGYNMLYVEHFTQYLHNFFNQMSIKVEESYAKPTKTKESLLLPDVGNKMFVDSVLTIHERVVQVSGLSATLAPIIVEVFTMNQPEGVNLLVKEHTEVDYLERFKARPDLENLRASMF
ncbi:39S ribosomal protein L48, mitochondrial isoform X2 [Hyla sarda]|uniref:39S ribosomal protein L48, mitochondrial isoform X2 n=2 Tax=Hyla sarda TaxID=327740 RepID=UPI0024C2E13C|nr:39S ribosomal protein L48, mitochondrial isoform X2 [Hyla sarda]